MGDWDCLCAFCAGPFGCYDAFEPETEYKYDERVLSEEDLEWLEGFRLLGFNPDSFSVSKCFITGPAKAHEFGQMGCEIGDDSNVPASKYGHSEPGHTSLPAYASVDPDDPLCFPFHTACFQLFAHAVQYQLTGKVGPKAEIANVDKDALFKAMSKRFEEYRCSLSLDYGELDEMSGEQYWWCITGHEAWVSNPFASPKISSFFESLKSQTPLPPPSTKEHAHTALATANPFTKIPKEVTCEILLNLPYTDLQHVAHSGLIPFDLRSVPAFWKRKLFLDMPFLFDFPELEGTPDWFQLYHELKRHCFATTPKADEVTGEVAGEIEDKDEDEDEAKHDKTDDEKDDRKDDEKDDDEEQNDEETEPENEDDSDARPVIKRDLTLVLGLANRRRVWTACSEIAVLYQDELKSASTEGRRIVDQEILDGSVSIGMPIVASPVVKDARVLSSYLVSSWKDLEEDVVMQVYFENHRDEEEGGMLRGICMKGERVFGQPSTTAASVTIKAGNWIKSLELNISGAQEVDQKAKVGVSGIKLHFQDRSDIVVGASVGDKRLLAVSEGMGITGLIGEFANDTFQRLGLLQCPRGTTNPLPYTPPTLQRHLWKSSLPPPTLLASTYKTGYWTPLRSYDTIPMEALIFCTTPAELSAITGFSSDPMMRSFGVQFKDGGEKWIGPRDKRGGEKKFEIDGPGGERMVKVEVGMNHLPMAIKITTSKGRVAFFGNNQKNGHYVYEPGEKGFVAGIYASWGYSDKRLCTSISVLTGAKDGEENEEVIGTNVNAAFSPPETPERPRKMTDNGSDYLAVVDEDGEEEHGERYW